MDEEEKFYTTIECLCRYIVVGYLQEIDRKVLIDQNWYCEDCKTKLYVSRMRECHERRIP